MDFLIFVREFLQLCQGGFEERFHSDEVVASGMVKRSRELNEPLQEGLFRFGGGQPDFFPDFVGLKKLAGIEQGDSPPEFFEFDCA